MKCSFCGSGEADRRLVGALDGSAICDDCVRLASDFFGATAAMPANERPATLEPRSAWDKRGPDTFREPNPWDRRRQG